jgi:hypothetical protein
MNIILAIFLLYQMFKLCSKSFSYSNFHIHEAYTFYTMAFLSVTLIIMSRLIQKEEMFISKYKNNINKALIENLIPVPPVMI